jgi:hypothetical protein
VGDQAIAEKCGDAALGAVKKLIRDEEFARAQIFLQRAHGTDGNDALHPQKFHCVDIRAEVEFAREDAVPAAVAGEERDALALEIAEDDLVA